MIKNDGFDQNGGHHELQAEKFMRNESRIVDFRATATRFMNIFVFLFPKQRFAVRGSYVSEKKEIGHGTSGNSSLRL